MKFENTTVHNIEGAIYSMRMPMMSHDKSDSSYKVIDEGDGDFSHLTFKDYIIGDADMKLAKSLVKGGAEHSKFLRSIYVDTVITAPQYWVSELDTYKISTVRNSSSLMHKGASKEFTLSDFTFDSKNEEETKALKAIIDYINILRQKYLDTKEYRYFRMMRQIMPMGYNYTFAYSTNYAQLRNMYQQRVKNPHRLKEWTQDFAKWIDTLPYADEFIK